MNQNKQLKLVNYDHILFKLLLNGLILTLIKL
jgi:hypothetical protein